MSNKLNNAVAPCGNFNLTSYKLNTPDGKTIVGKKLTDDYTSQWFYTYAEDGSMTFYTPSNGSDTTHAQRDKKMFLWCDCHLAEVPVFYKILKRSGGPQRAHIQDPIRDSELTLE